MINEIEIYGVLCVKDDVISRAKVVDTMPNAMLTVELEMDIRFSNSFW